MHNGLWINHFCVTLNIQREETDDYQNASDSTINKDKIKMNFYLLYLTFQQNVSYLMWGKAPENLNH